MSETTLVAEERTAFGKGAARAVRRAKKVPAVLYGHGQDPRHLSLPGHQLMLALKHGGSNALLTLDLGNGEQQLALPKAVTRDPIKGFLEHVDLIVVRRGEKVTINVPVTTTGEVRSDILLTQPLTELSVEAEATHIPTGFEVAVEGIEPGVTIYARDIELPTGVTLVTDPDSIVLSAQGAQTAEQVEAELAGAEADAGITHDAPQGDSAGETPAE